MRNRLRGAAVATGVKDRVPRQVLDTSAYQAFWSVRADNDIFRMVEEQFESWLREKSRWDPPTETNGYLLGPDGQELLTVHHRDADGRSMRFRLVEPKGDSSWRTNVTVH